MAVVSEIKQGDATGRVVLSALLAIGYAAYSFYEYGWNNTNAVILMVSGILTMLAAGPATFYQPPPPSMRWLPAVTGAICTALAAYQCFIIGFLAVGVAFSEWSGWSVFIWAIIWIAVGGSALSGLRVSRSVRRHRAALYTGSQLGT